jgi:lipoprotein Spr
MIDIYENQKIIKDNIKHYIFICVFSLFLLDCAAQPRFRSEPVEHKKSEVISEGEAKQTEETPSTYAENQSSVDQFKMERILESFLGTPYKRGGETKTGMDCSGLVVAVYRQYAGFKLPHDTKKLYKLVKRIDKDNLAYGDLVFFSDGWYGVSHVGIYLGGGKFVHSMEDFGVIVSALNEDYYKKGYIGARRVIP